MSKFNAKKMIVVDLDNGSYLEEQIGHEIFNLEKNPVDGKYYGYCPPWPNYGITIKNFDKTAENFIDDILVVYVKKEKDSINREIIAFCPNARAYRKPQVKERLKRIINDKTGKKKGAPYSFESDTLYDLRDYPDKYKIRTKKYNKDMFRMQRFYGGKYPELDKEIIKYIEKYLEKVENQ